MKRPANGVAGPVTGVARVSDAGGCNREARPVTSSRASRATYYGSVTCVSVSTSTVLPARQPLTVLRE